MKHADSRTSSLRVEANIGEGFWRKGPQDSLPPPDMTGAYMRNRPVLGAPVAGRKAWIIGSGIAGLAAAFYLIRDGGMAGEDITILDTLDVAGGSLDGAGNAEQGYIVRGGREMNWNYDNFWTFSRTCRRWSCPRATACSTSTATLTTTTPTGPRPG